MPFRLLMIAVLLFSALDLRASEKTPARPLALKNVELSASRELSIQVVDTHGQGIPGAIVTARYGKLLKTAITDKTGRAVIPELSGGTCLLQTSKQQFACRTWMNGTAPPKAVTSLALVTGDASIVLGNRFSRKQCPENYCEPCERTGCLSSNTKNALGLAALGGTAAYFALSRDNASD